MAWLCAIRKESIQEKYNEHSQGHMFRVQRVQKQWCLAKLLKITFILFECHEFIDFFSYRETVHDNKDSNRRNSKSYCGSEIPILSIFIYVRFQQKSMKIFCHRQISEYYDQKDHAHFRPPPPKSSAYSNNSFLRYSQFLSPETRVATPILDHANRNIFQSTFNLHESVWTFKKSGFFIILF